MSKAQFDKFAADYDKILSDSLHTDGADLAYYSSYKVALMRRLAPPGVSRILDFGCGIGKTIGHLKQAFPAATVDGCDVSPDALEVARAANPGANFFMPASSEAMQGAYDLAFLANVLHHIQPAGRGDWFKALRRMLKPGGSIFFFEHNPLNPVVRHIVRTCPLDEDAVLVHPCELRRLSEKAGCRVATWGYTLFFGAGLRRLSFLEPWLRWLPLGAQYYMQVIC